MPNFAGLAAQFGRHMHATGVHLAIQLLTGSAEVRFDCVTALLMAGLAIGAAAYQRIRKKQLSPILLIIAAAALGILIY